MTVFEYCFGCVRLNEVTIIHLKQGAASFNTLIIINIYKKNYSFTESTYFKF